MKDLQKILPEIKKDVSTVPLRTTSPNGGSSHLPAQPKTQQPPEIDQTLRCRYELKYFVSESTAQLIRGFVQGFLPFDKYSKRNSGAYPLVSLYLDSHNLQLCRESLDGRKNRFKLRIRSYTDEPNYPFFMEIKRRIDGICLKDRARISRCHLDSILGSAKQNIPLSEISTDDHALSQFLLYSKSINAGPVIKIRYMREAFEDHSHNRVRVTFDRQLAFKAVHTGDIMLNGTGWQPHTEQGVVVEIKFTDNYPTWINRMIQMFDLQRQSFSKYARSVEKCCLMKFCAPEVPAQRIVNR